MASREADDICCLKRRCLSNSDSVIRYGSARVEVRAFESKSKKPLVVAWKEGGSATFHAVCWEALVQATKDSTSLITLSDVERSMILDAKKTAEHHDCHEMLSLEAERIADILRHANHCISFTGAGISTAAGIGDFRGKDGKWTERDKVKNFGPQKKGTTAARGVVYEALRPTYTHEALCKLVEMGKLKFIISQNCDGLHSLSGIPADNISELHGNTFVEKCEKCNHRYERPLACRRSADPKIEKKCPTCRISHRTGRRCTQKGCDGFLMNTIINFGDYLEKNVLERAAEEARKSDAVLVLGSTLRVSPANDLIAMGQFGSKIVICNRQSTPYDAICKLVGSRVFGDCDDLMRRIMTNLLPAEELKAWHEARSARMTEYDLKRKVTVASSSKAKAS